MTHIFKGKWITDNEFYNLEPRNIFHKQLDKIKFDCSEHRNRHVLFRKKFSLQSTDKNAKIYITADDYYKLYINGSFVSSGPAPSYHCKYNYNVIDVSEYLNDGENLIAVHTLYQGLINRVWQSGDNRHGLILDLVIDEKTVISSDESFKTAVHSAYSEMGTSGYQTQFLERYDSNSAHIGFEKFDFNDDNWQNAKVSKFADYTLSPQQSGMLEFEKILPVSVRRTASSVIYDFGSNYVGYLNALVKGVKGDIIKVKCAQELGDDGSLRHEMRCYCNYEEEWILSDGESTLDWFDYKSFRYAELCFGSDIEIIDVYMTARHYPFTLKAKLKNEYENNPDLQKIWNLCVHSQKYGVQEVIQDCMDREKGFYLGDGCYSALANMILTQDDSMVRKLIDDAFSTEFVTDTLITCMCCSFMQEIAEYPLIMVYLALWHYNYTKDKEYLLKNYKKIVKLLDAYRREYEKDYLLKDVDKWCVVEWPKNFQHGYDVDINEGKVCEQAHVSLNAYYIAAVKTANTISQILGFENYRDEKSLMNKFMKTFYNEKEKLFKDGENTEHISLVGNVFPYAFGICTDKEFNESFVRYYKDYGISSLSFFCSFPLLVGFVRNNRQDLVTDALLDEGAWKRMLREGATTTFEGWGKDTKWNTSLFHLTLTDAAVFMADIDLKELFSGI